MIIYKSQHLQWAKAQQGQAPERNKEMSSIDSI